MNETLILFTLMGMEAKALYEFKDVASKVGINLKFKRSKSPGIILAEGTIEDESLIKRLFDLIAKENWRFHALKKIAHVNHRLFLDDENAWKTLIEKISSVVYNKTYRISIHRVKNQQLKKAIINKLAEKIDSKVDLENYEIEIAGYFIDNELFLFFQHQQTRYLLIKLDFQTFNIFSFISAIIFRSSSFNSCLSFRFNSSKIMLSLYLFKFSKCSLIAIR